MSSDPGVRPSEPATVLVSGGTRPCGGADLSSGSCGWHLGAADLLAVGCEHFRSAAGSPSATGTQLRIAEAASSGACAHSRLAEVAAAGALGEVSIVEAAASGACAQVAIAEAPRSVACEQLARCNCLFSQFQTYRGGHVAAGEGDVADRAISGGGGRAGASAVCMGLSGGTRARDACRCLKRYRFRGTLGNDRGRSQRSQSLTVKMTSHRRGSHGTARP